MFISLFNKRQRNTKILLLKRENCKNGRHSTPGLRYHDVNGKSFLLWRIFYSNTYFNPASQACTMAGIQGMAANQFEWLVMFTCCFYHCNAMQCNAMHCPNVSRAMVMWPPCWRVTDWLTDHLTKQTRTNMSQPGRRPGTAVGDERHVLQTLWSRKFI